MPPTEDLWDCLEQASGKPIAAVMSSWTKQMGFPIIEVEEEQVSPDRPSCVPPFCVFFFLYTVYRHLHLLIVTQSNSQEENTEMDRC